MKVKEEEVHKTVASPRMKRFLSVQHVLFKEAKAKGHCENKHQR